MIHHSLITHSIIVKLVGILLLLHIVCWTTVYYLALKYRLIQYPYLFLSTAFGSDPARAVAAFILPMISVLTGLLLGMRSALIKPRIKTRIQRRLMFAFNVCIILTCVGLLGVSAISIYTNIYVHLIFAFIVFISGILIMLLSTYFDSILKLPVSTFVQSIRYALTVVAVVSGICLGVFFVPYPFLGSLMEMIATGSMTAYFVTFAHKLESVDVPIVAELEQVIHAKRRIV